MNLKNYETRVKTDLVKQKLFYIKTKQIHRSWKCSGFFFHLKGKKQKGKKRNSDSLGCDDDGGWFRPSSGKPRPPEQERKEVD